MDFLNGLFSFVTDTSKKVTHKAFTILSLLILAYAIDNLLGFTYYWNIENKVEVVEKINKVLIDSSLSAQDKSQLIEIRSLTIQRESLKDKIWNYLTDSSSNIKPANENFRTYPIVKILSGTWFFILIIFIAPFVNYSETSRFKRILLIFVVIVVTGFAGLVANKLLGLIPILFGNILFNYLLNAMVNLCLLIITIKVGSKNPRTDDASH